METAEWAYDRPDVVGVIAHRRAPVLESFAAGGFEGHHYLGVLPLPGRYLIDGVRVRARGGPGRFTVSRLAVVDPESGRSIPVSLAAAYVSDAARFREVAATPGVRLFESTATVGPARVVERLRILAGRRRGPVAPWPRPPPRASTPGGRPWPRRATRGASRCPRARAPGGRRWRGEGGSRVEVRAEGPGLLVVAQSWDPGWSASVDGRPAAVLRVNHAQIGRRRSPRAPHRVALRYQAARPGGREPGWRRRPRRGWRSGGRLS